MLANRLVISGTLQRAPKRKISPNGVLHLQFILSHQSVQQEAGLMRRVWCNIPVIASGAEWQQLAQVITLGSQVKVSGFICQQQHRQGTQLFVLHAEQIELLNSGEKPNGTLFPSS